VIAGDCSLDLIRRDQRKAVQHKYPFRCGRLCAEREPTPDSRVRCETTYGITPQIPTIPKPSAIAAAVASITSVNDVRASDSA
jgi:hypothetical protein